jgi:predicted metal-dependent peptidase
MLTIHDSKILLKVESSLKLVCVSLPYLSLLAYIVEPIIDSRISTIGVTQTGKLLINPTWYDDLTINESVFILAHELLHIALKHHERESEQVDHIIANIVQDFIINDILSKELSMSVPKGGLYLENASEKSFEQLLLEMKNNSINQKYSWKKNESTNQERVLTIFEEALLKAQSKKNNKIVNKEEKNTKISMDIISQEQEKELFPEFSNKMIRDKVRIINEVSDKVIALHKLEKSMNKNIGTDAGNMSYFEKLIHNKFIPPWESYLQKWFDDTSSTSRSFYKASRRTYQDKEIVIAGKKREGFTLNILLDTSGSMLNSMSKILGIIASFCNANNINNIRVIQCDSEITVDNIITPYELENYEILGCGGSDMTPAMDFLSNDYNILLLIIITDGFIYYPKYVMPYEVLWVLTYENIEFNPEYGQKILIDKYL